MAALNRFVFSVVFVLISSVLFAQVKMSANFKKAESNFKSEDYTGAIEYYTKDLADNPNNLNAYYRRGFTYSMLHNYKAATRDYSIVIRKDPKYVWAYISRGSARHKLKKYDEAVTDFDTAIELDPKNQEAYNNRGWAKHALGDKKGACKDWKHSKKMGNGEAKIILSNTHCK